MFGLIFVSSNVQASGNLTHSGTVCLHNQLSSFHSTVTFKSADV